MNTDKMIKSHSPKVQLSKKLWKDEKLLKDVKIKLLEIADQFINYLGIDIDIKDITMTGSLANYNYTPYSDIDLHIIVNYDELTSKEDLAKEFFNAKKSFWNSKYDILIKGIEVELYSQDASEEHASSGVYSLIEDKWLIKPKQFSNNIDKEYVKSKFNKIKKEINLVISDSLKEESVDNINRLLKKIKKMREAGLKSKGEYSNENVIYKLIRVNGNLQKLFDNKTKILNKNLSL